MEVPGASPTGNNDEPRLVFYASAQVEIRNNVWRSMEGDEGAKLLHEGEGSNFS